jgi:toxin ParE1/3/4
LSVGLKKRFSLSNKSPITLPDDNPEAAARTAQHIYARVEELAIFPHRGRVGRKEGTRELVPAPLPYIVVYRVKESAVEILQIRHGAQHAA